jgi:ABC-type thiamin/hydroxymethylpyrimidine transport system permease subunit
VAAGTTGAGAATTGGVVTATTGTTLAAGFGLGAVLTGELQALENIKMATVGRRQSFMPSSTATGAPTRFLAQSR